jgi:hypothetical protein
MNEVELALEELANRFEMAGDVTWTSSQVADALRRFLTDRDAPLTNREDDED